MYGSGRVEINLNQDGSYCGGREKGGPQWANSRAVKAALPTTGVGDRTRNICNISQSLARMVC